MESGRSAHRGSARAFAAPLGGYARNPGDATYMGGGGSALSRFAPADRISRFGPRSAAVRSRFHSDLTLDSSLLWVPGTGARFNERRCVPPDPEAEGGAEEAATAAESLATGWAPPRLFSKRRDPQLAMRYAFAGCIMPTYL